MKHSRVIIGGTNRPLPGLNNVLLFAPPLIARKFDIDEVVEAVDGALRRCGNADKFPGAFSRPVATVPMTLRKGEIRQFFSDQLGRRQVALGVLQERVEKHEPVIGCLVRRSDLLVRCSCGEITLGHGWRSRDS